MVLVEPVCFILWLYSHSHTYYGSLEALKGEAFPVPPKKTWQYQEVHFSIHRLLRNASVSGALRARVSQSSFESFLSTHYDQGCPCSLNGWCMILRVYSNLVASDWENSWLVRIVRCHHVHVFWRALSAICGRSRWSKVKTASSLGFSCSIVPDLFL